MTASAAAWPMQWARRGQPPTAARPEGPRAGAGRLPHSAARQCRCRLNALATPFLHPAGLCGCATL